MTNTRSILRGALALCLVLAAQLTMAPARAADAARGAALYANTNGAPISCANSSCHGANPATNKNKIAKGANAPSVITAAIVGNTGGMGYLSAYCDATCSADIAAYIANPAAATSPVATLAPAALTFAGTNVGSTSAAQTVTLTNSGAGSLTVSGLSLTGTAAADYVRGGTCAIGTGLAAGASCSVTVAFAPTAAGTRSASLTVTHNATGGSSTVSLTGTGVVVTAPSIAVSATLLDFGSVVVATPAAARTVTVSNPGTATLTISGVSFTGANPTDFTRSGGTCAGTLGVGASCTIGIGFTPGAIGGRSATMTITGNASNGNPTVTLTGTGQAAPAPVASLNATSIAWGSVTIGSTATQSVTLSNVGNAAMSIASVTIGGATTFTVGSNGCGASLAGGASCTIGVAFRPVAAVASTATLTIVDGAAGSPHTVALSGTGTAAPTALPQWVSTAPLVFAQYTVGQQSPAQTATLTNAGNAPMQITSLALAGAAAGDFVRGGTCAVGSALATGQSCTVTVTFAPTAAGTRVATVTLGTDGGASLSLDLSGTGAVLASATAAVAPAVLDFGLVATADAQRAITVSNAGTKALTMQSMTLAAPFSFIADTVANACPPLPFALLPGQSCERMVRFAPLAPGAASGDLVVTTDATNAVLHVPLAGSAPAAAAATPASAPTAPAIAAAGPGLGSGATPQNLGGAGCTTGDGPADPTLPLISLFAAVLLARRAPSHLSSRTQR